MMQSELSTIVTYNPWTISGDTTLSELIDMLSAADFHHWPVVDEDQQLIGMLADSDLVRTFEAGSAALVAASQEKIEIRRATIRNQPVREVMSTQVIGIQQNESTAVALWTMLEHKIHALPILTDSYLTALATTSDFLREFSYGSSSAATLTASETMLEPCEAVDCDSSLEEVAMAMQFARSSVIPVVRGDLPLGVISRRDVGMLRLHKTLKEVFGESVREEETSILAFAASAPTIRPGERLSHVANVMIEHQRQSVAVVNQAGRLLGVITEEVILRAMLGSMRSSPSLT